MEVPITNTRVVASDLERRAGACIVGGFDGLELPESYARALRAGLRGGLIVFRRNLASLEQASELCRSARASAPPADEPLFVCVDQEGGRVSRLPPPFPRLPPMRELGACEALDDQALASLGRAVGELLASLGFTVNFAPVLDVDSNPNNPVIGDRAFASDAARVARRALAFGGGLEAGGVLACGKHFPGHGDTDTDSHVDLPIVRHDRERLDRVELAPFRAAALAKLGSLMTAHVVCEALDPSVPATLSHRICTELLRHEIGFDGVLFSDDLEMAAIAGRAAIEDAVIESVRAGCDAILICKHEDLQARAVEALAREASRDPAFARRLAEAESRVRAARARLGREGEPRRRSFDEVLASSEVARAFAAAARALASHRGGDAPREGADPTERL